MFKRVISAVIGSRHERERKKIQPIVDEINEHYARLHDVSEEELRAPTAKFLIRAGDTETIVLVDLLAHRLVVLSSACARSTDDSSRPSRPATDVSRSSAPTSS